MLNSTSLIQSCALPTEIAEEKLRQRLNALGKVQRGLNLLAGATVLTLDEVKGICVFHESKLVRNLGFLQEIQLLTVHIVKSSTMAISPKRDRQVNTCRQSLRLRYQHLSHQESFRNLDGQVVSYY